MTECDIHNKQGILLIVDFEKAFHALDWKFIHKVMKLSNFGTRIQNWIKILQKGSQSIVTKYGYFSNRISLG